MANKSYPIFGKVKTIVLPYVEVGTQYSEEEYYEKYGIKLTDIFELKPNDDIDFKETYKNTLFYIFGYESNRLMPVLSSTPSEHQLIIGLSLTDDGDVIVEGDGVVITYESSEFKIAGYEI